MTCRYCNKPLGFLQRVSGQHYCSAAHQKAHIQEQEQAAIERLRHMAVTAPQVETKPEVKPPEPEPRAAPSPRAEVPPAVRSEAPQAAEPPASKVTSTPRPAPPMQKPVTPVAAAGQTIPSTEEIPLPAFLTKGRKRDAPKARKPIDRASIDDLDDVPLPSFMVRGARSKAKSGSEEPAPESPARATEAPSGATASQSLRDEVNSGTDEIQVPASVSKRRRAMDAAKPAPAETVVEAQAPAKEAEEPPAAPAPDAPFPVAPEITAEVEVKEPEVPQVVVEAPAPEKEVEPAPIAVAESAVPAEAVQTPEAIPEPEPVAEPAPEFDRYVLPALSPLTWEAPSVSAPAEAGTWAGYRLEPTPFEDRPIQLPAATLSPAGRIPDAPPVAAIPFQPVLTAFRPGSVQPAAAPSVVHEQPANMALLVPVGPDVEPLLQAPQQAINLPHVREGRPMPVPVEPSAGTAEAAQPLASWRVAPIKHLEIEGTALAGPSQVAELDMAGPLAEEIDGVATPPVVGEPSGTLRGQLDTRTPATEIAAIPATPELTAVGWLPLQTAAAPAATAPSEESGALRGMGAPPLVGSGTVTSEPDPRALSEMFARPEQRSSTFDADALAVKGSAEPRKDSWTSFPARPCQVPDMTFEPVAVQLALEVTAEAQAPPRPMRSRFRKPVPFHLSGRDVQPLPKLVPVGCDFRSAPLARANLS